MTSAAATARARYSASVLDRARVGCFFADQETILFTIKTQWPDVERRLIGQPAQCLSKQSIWKENPDIVEGHNLPFHANIWVCDRLKMVITGLMEARIDSRQNVIRSFFWRKEIASCQRCARIPKDPREVLILENSNLVCYEEGWQLV